MATDTAHAPTRHDPTRNIWQWPAFLVGVGVFVAAWRGVTPLGPSDPTAEFPRELAALRKQADSSHADAAALADLVRQVAADADRHPGQAALADFLLGTGHGRLAECNPVPDEALAEWAAAVRHFERVAPDRLPGDDVVRLAFRTEKARAGVGFPSDASPSRIDAAVRTLAAVPPDEPFGELNRIIADLHLRQSLPEPERAKEALRRYLGDAGPTTPAANQARAKLRLGEIHASLNEVEEARKWLAHIGPDAPPDVLAPASARLAAIHMSENAWDKAAGEWELARKAMAALPAASAAGSKDLAAYQLGVCRLMSKQTDAALKLFDEVSRGGGAEGFAAVVKATDIALRNPDAAAHKSAADALVAASKGLNSPAAYSNPFVPLPELRATFEQAVQALQSDGAYEAALAAADAYGKVAVAGREREKRAEIFVAWGESLRKAGLEPKEKLGAAADEYVALAKLDGTPPAARADDLRKAAGLYRRAENPPAVLVALGRLVKLPEVSNDAVGTAWVDMAEVLLDTRRPDEALKAFQQAMLTSGPAAMAARYKLARLLLDVRDPKKAPLGTELLKQIAGAETVAPAEAEFQEKALVELGQEALKAGDFPYAESLFRKQLGNPAGPEAGLGKFLLGVCILQQTARPADAADDKSKVAESRAEALSLFESLVKEADDKKARGDALTEREAWLRTQARLRVLQAYQQMGKPGDVVVAAAKVIDENRGKVEELIARSMMYHAWKQQNRPELALKVMDEMKRVYRDLPDAAYHGGTGEYSKGYWEKVWFAPPEETAPIGATAPTESPKPSPARETPREPARIEVSGGASTGPQNDEAPRPNPFAPASPEAASPIKSLPALPPVPKGMSR